jgi:hypothetical protein
MRQLQSQPEGPFWLALQHTNSILYILSIIYLYVMLYAQN